MQTILITGGTGLIGTALTQYLAQHYPELQLQVLTRQTQLPALSSQNLRYILSLDEASAPDVIINLAGEPIASRRWTAKQRDTIWQSRVEQTQVLVDFIQQSAHKPKLLISGSAIGYYGVGREKAIIDENGSSDNSFASRLCQAWEQQASAVEALGVRCCILRTGIVLSNQGGALANMLPAFKLGLGGPIGDGKQWMPWIHINDMVRIIAFCLEDQQLAGPINCVSPGIVQNQEFAKQLASALSRPGVLPMPAIMIKLLFG
ncbi:MAG: TIGR01777 family protein, partial [Pseudomonadales bacterium]|nr:TIGR01777 family protein [Pseudomonadales bacterium]